MPRPIAEEWNLLAGQAAVGVNHWKAVGSAVQVLGRRKGGEVLPAMASSRPAECAVQRKRSSRIKRSVEVAACKIDGQRRGTRVLLIGNRPLRVSERRTSPGGNLAIEPRLF